MYSYDKPLVVQYATTGAITTKVLAANMVAELAHPAKRVLEGSVLLGIAGTITTAGDLTINIGDGATADRYGKFVMDTGLVVGAPVSGTLTLTEEGYHMGVSNDPNTPQTFTLTGDGTGIGDMVFVVGYY